MFALGDFIVTATDFAETGWRWSGNTHGGAKGSGAPKGNRNALKHGRFTRQAIDERRELIRAAEAELERFEKC